MRLSKRLASGAFFRWALIVLLSLFTIPVWLHSQTNENAVWQSATVFTGSPAFIDASTFDTTSDICTRINAALTSGLLPSTGGVVDARGIVNSTGGAETSPCTSNPFSTGTGTYTGPATVLLPASTIPVEVPWVLPAGTRLIGEGPFTIIQACVMSVNHCGSTFSGTDVIDMGTSGCTGCSGITIEHLKVDGNGLLVNGIRNYSGDPSYVSDVNFAEIGIQSGSGGGSATALIVDANAAGSGPYTNLNLTSGGICGTGGCGACVSIQAPTRGLHGITCSSVGVGAAAKAAIYVNANNNSVEDVHIEVFTDGIQIGTPSGTTPVSNVVVSNVTGANVVNVVHVCGTNYGSASCGNTAAPNDVALFHISNGSTAGADAILDDVTGTATGVIPTGGASSTVGMYLLGTSVVDSNGKVAVPRFTTAPGIFGTSGGGVPTWAVGTMAPSGSSCGLTGANGAGSLYSNTTGKFGSKNTLFICISGSWKGVSTL